MKQNAIINDGLYPLLSMKICKGAKNPVKKWQREHFAIFSLFFGTSKNPVTQKKIKGSLELSIYFSHHFSA